MVPSWLLKQSVASVKVGQVSIGTKNKCRNFLSLILLNNCGTIFPSSSEVQWAEPFLALFFMLKKKGTRQISRWTYCIVWNRKERKEGCQTRSGGLGLLSQWWAWQPIAQMTRKWWNFQGGLHGRLALTLTTTSPISTDHQNHQLSSY